MDEFYVTLFSTSSQKLYPNNSQSKFTVKLPRPLTFNSNEKWCVGLVDCSHPGIIGTIRGSGNEQDIIIFPESPSVLGHIVDVHTMAILILQNARHPDLYSKRYFNDFLDIENLKEFEVNSKINKHRVAPLGRSIAFKVSPFSIASQYRGTDTEKAYITLETERPYTGKQILWVILNLYHKILIDAETNPKTLKEYKLFKGGKSIAEMLQHYALTVINTIRLHAKHGFDLEEHESEFLLIYTDIIEGHIVGNEIAKVLFLTHRQKHMPIDHTDVKHVQYFPLCKSYIEDISILFTDENASQLILESGYSPTSIVLKFKKF